MIPREGISSLLLLLLLLLLAHCIIPYYYFFLATISDKENSVGLFELYGMETDIEFVRLNPQQVQDAAQRAGLARFLAFEAYHNGAKADQCVPRSGTGANSQDDPQLNAFIERLRDRA